MAVMTQEVADRDPIRRDRVLQTEFRDIVANRFCPVEPSLINEHCETRGRERLGDRTDRKLRRSLSSALRLRQRATQPKHV
jgi:hypothetical protein